MIKNMKSFLRIAVAVFVLGGVLIGGFVYANREKKPGWSDFISIRKIKNDAQIEGSWALNGWTGFMGTALQLQNGHFKYWFYSDVKTADEPSYPLSGTYSVSGGKLVLSDASGLRERVWIYGVYDDREGLWQESDLEVVIRRAESPSVRMLRKVSPLSDPKKPIYNVE